MDQPRQPTGPFPRVTRQPPRKRFLLEVAIASVCGCQGGGIRWCRPAGVERRPFCYNATEFCVLLRDLDLALSHGADGAVFGILNDDATVDRIRCREVVRQAGNKPVVFHRAFDLTPEPGERVKHSRRNDRRSIRFQVAIDASVRRTPDLAFEPGHATRLAGRCR
jgi:hypothetical protein